MFPCAFFTISYSGMNTNCVPGIVASRLASWLADVPQHFSGTYSRVNKTIWNKNYHLQWSKVRNIFHSNHFHSFVVATTAAKIAGIVVQPSHYFFLPWLRFFFRRQPAVSVCHTCSAHSPCESFLSYPAYQCIRPTTNKTKQKIERICWVHGFEGWARTGWCYMRLLFGCKR